MPDYAPDVPLKISEESDNAARTLIDELIYDLLENGPKELEHDLVSGEVTSRYLDSSRWYHDLSKTDKEQVMNVALLSMENALFMFVGLLDHLKFFVGPGYGGPGESILHYGLYAELYPEAYEEGQQPLTQVQINPLRLYEERLSEMLRKKLRDQAEDKK